MLFRWLINYIYRLRANSVQEIRLFNHVSVIQDVEVKNVFCLLKY